MGGLTALAFAARMPERVLTLIVAGISPDREPRASVTRRLMDPDRIERADPAWAAEMARSLDPVQGAGAWRRLARAVADDVATQPLMTRRRVARDHSADAGRCAATGTRWCPSGRPGSCRGRFATDACSWRPTAATMS